MIEDGYRIYQSPNLQYNSFLLRFQLIRDYYW
ncbi:Uncharacterised protein [Legionella spiritensis]|nr:Uncharacterised protein [Legionella spiritensis]